LRDQTPAPSGLEERLRLKLGLRDQLHFHVVEHVLLRPLAEDIGQVGEEGEDQVPLLADVISPDPWSLQVSYVFEDLGNADADFELLVGQTILAETPAHLTPHLHWFGAAQGAADGQADDVDHWGAFGLAWSAFQTHYHAYRAAKLRATQVDAEIHLPARDARDRVIDLLGFGRTYPLRDLPLIEHVIVAPGTPASVTLHFSQIGVDYELRHLDGTPSMRDGKPITAEGTGGELVLPTPPIEEDVSYRILAVKREDASDAEKRRETWLRGTVRIEEGVDPALIAQLRLPLLDPRIDAPKASDARITDHGATVEVEVLASQEGVAYVLIDHAAQAEAISQPVVGTSGIIVLTFGPVTEDIDLRVRGSKEVGDPQKPEVRTAVLDLILPLRVRANPAATAKLVPAVIPHGGSTVVELGKTQKSVSYQVWQRRLRDREIVFAQSPAVATIDVADGKRTIRVERPEKPAVWQNLPGFAALGQEKAGTGGKLTLALDALEEDEVLLVQAIKQHRSGPLSSNAETIASAVQLDRALALLVRPDHAQPLRVLATITGDATQGPLHVRDGQAGVYYELRLTAADPAIDRPVYFHQRDDVAARLNKGVDQLRIEVDFAVARDAEGAPGNPAQTAPPGPALDAELAPGTALYVLARKAMTGLEAELDHTVTVEAADD
ncbi:MAG TPA: hypothetical protein VNM90_00435, partial [Haliangium sp.]|nr:hypothetical protein [Haliangium sp.]